MPTHTHTLLPNSSEWIWCGWCGHFARKRKKRKFIHNTTISLHIYKFNENNFTKCQAHDFIFQFEPKKKNEEDDTKKKKQWMDKQHETSQKFEIKQQLNKMKQK